MLWLDTTNDTTQSIISWHKFPSRASAQQIQSFTFEEGVRAADMYGYMDQKWRKDLIIYPKFKTILPIYLFSVSLFIATTLNKWFI